MLGSSGYEARRAPIAASSSDGGGGDNNYGRDRWSVSNRGKKQSSNIDDVNINDDDDDDDDKKKKKK